MKSAVVFVMAMWVLGDAAWAVQIPIRSKVYTGGPRILLSELADFSALPRKAQLQLQTGSLGDAPSYGEARHFSSQAISGALRKHLPPEVLSEIKLTIPSEVSIVGKGVLVDVPHLRSFLADRIQNFCDPCDVIFDDLQVKERNLPPNSKWSVDGDYSQVRGSFNLPLRIEVPGQNPEVQFVQGRIRIHKRVPVASKLLNFGSAIRPGDFELASRDVTFVRDSFPSSKELEQARIATTVAVGQILSRGMLAKERAVQAGEEVTVTIGSDGWKVSLKAIAQQGGVVGESIRLLNPQSRKIISGTIIAKGTVESK